MAPMVPPTGLEFGKKMGSLIAGHSLFIPGKPVSFSPLLGRHFFLVETVIRPAADALWFANSISCYFSYPGRTDLAQLAQEDSAARLKSQLWWSQHVTQKPFADPINMAIRGGAVGFHLSLLFPWFLASACFPGMVHQVLSTAAGITAKKHEATSEGAPTGNWGFDYNGHSATMYRLEKAHGAAAHTSYFCPFTCCIAIIWLLFFKLAPNAGGGGAQQQGPVPFWPGESREYPGHGAQGQMMGYQQQQQQQPPPPSASQQQYGFGGQGFPGAGRPA